MTWAEHHFYLDTGLPIRLEPHQRALVLAIVAHFLEGRGRTAIYSTIKKSGKTTTAALITRYLAEHAPPGREIYLVANDLDQAQNRVFAAIRTSVERDPAAKGRWRITDRELRLRNGTFVRAIPDDYRGEAGANPYLTVWTELWGFDSESARRLFEELTPVPNQPSFRLIETYAGFEGESDLLRDLYDVSMYGEQLRAADLAQLTGTPLGVFAEAGELDHPVPVWANPRAGILCYWDKGLAARRMPWQHGTHGEAFYAEQRNTLRPANYRRLHLNEWTQGDEPFVPIEWWDACQEYLPPHQWESKEMVVGIDAGVTRDSFAYVGVVRHPHRPRCVAIVLWGEISAPVDFTRARQEIRDVIKRYPVVQIAYDPYQMVLFADELRRERTVWLREFPQGPERNEADGLLYELIRDRRIAHCGPDSIRRHLLNAKAEITAADRVRMVKRSSQGKIDLAVALSMAARECLRLNIS